MHLPQDFKEFIELMIASNVRFVMIGGYAYNLYRNPRATGDIDFFVASNLENENRLRKVLELFGFGSTLPPKTERLLNPRKVLMLGRTPMRIDILTKIDGVSFDDVEATAQFIQVDGVRIPVISAEMLLRNKESTLRAKDLADAAELRAWLHGDD
ncbi:MAG: nucleotidyl transferase AbiEii/AbiGii toxin family protein [Pirellula sp.]